jgi:hypothetical protein
VYWGKSDQSQDRLRQRISDPSGFDSMPVSDYVTSSTAVVSIH